MKDLLTKIFAVFALIVFVTILINHGQIDFSAWDKFTKKTQDAVNSKKGQQLIQEVKDTSYDVGSTFLDKFRDDARKFKENHENESINEIEEEIGENDLSPVKFVRVVDGDTIIVKDGSNEETYVRLIGIDTPESVNPDETLNNEYGEKSSAFTKAVLTGKDIVYLQFDKECFDQYDRALAYVWLKSDIDKSNVNDIRNYMLNGILLQAGYAKDKIYEPNVRYSSVFSQICRDSQNIKSGLWKEEGFVQLW